MKKSRKRSTSRSKRNTSWSFGSRSKSREKPRDYQWVHPLYNPIDHKLAMLNDKFKSMNKSGFLGTKSSTSQVSFNDTHSQKFSTVTPSREEGKPTANKEYQSKIIDHMLEKNSEQNQEKCETPRSRAKNLKTGYSIESGGDDMFMSSLQLSQINPPDNDARNHQKAQSHISINSSSMFLKNFKETKTEDPVQEKQQKYPKSRSRVENLLKKESIHKKKRSKSTVFKRLYSQAKKKTNKLKSIKRSRSRKSRKHSLSRSQKLYESGKSRLRRIRSEKKISTQSIDDEEYTFVPKINYNSRSLVMAKGRNIHQTEANLLKYGKKRKDRLAEKIKEKEIEETSKYSFRPTLVAKPDSSQGKAQMRGLGYNRIEEKEIYKVHNKLFSQAERQRKAKEKMQEKQEYSFNPKILQSKYDNNRMSKSNTVKNLYKWKDELEQKIEQKRQQKEKEDVLRDEKTGQQLFKPITNNTDMTRHRNKDVFKYLYSLHSSRSKSKKSKKNKENEFRVDKDLTPYGQKTKSFRLNKKSKQILEKAERKRLLEIFTQMDSNYDGFISAEMISLENLSNEELDCLTPFLIYLENTGANVNFDLFYSLIRDPYFRKNLNISQKHQLRDRNLESAKKSLNDS